MTVVSLRICWTGPKALGSSYSSAHAVQVDCVLVDGPERPLEPPLDDEDVRGEDAEAEEEAGQDGDDLDAAAHVVLDQVVAGLADVLQAQCLRSKQREQLE